MQHLYRLLLRIVFIYADLVQILALQYMKRARDLANVYSFIVPLINNVIGNVSAKLTRSCPTPCKRLPPLQTTLQ